MREWFTRARSRARVTDAPATRGRQHDGGAMFASPTTRRIRRLAMPAVFALAGACAHTPPETAASPAPTVIEFNNQSLAQASVFVRAPGQTAHLLGTVAGGRQEELVVPVGYADKGNITIFARLLARSAVPTSGSIAIGPGDKLNVRLPEDERALFVLPATS
jgi:hypothetical protein